MYGLGERGKSRSLVFSFQTIPNIPPNAKLIGRGLDFGFSNDPSALVETYIEGDNMYTKGVIVSHRNDQSRYRQGTTTGWEWIGEMRYGVTVQSQRVLRKYTEWDTMLKRTYKGAINISIDMIRRYKLYVTENSINMIKELRNYKYIEDKNGQLTNKPIDAFNHTLDALRYSIVNKLGRPQYGKYYIR